MATNGEVNPAETCGTAVTASSPQNPTLAQESANIGANLGGPSIADNNPGFRGLTPRISFPAQSKITKRSRWRNLKTKIKRLLRPLKASRPTSYEDDWTREIKIEVQQDGHVYPCHAGVAWIDTQCPMDLMGREFASLFGITTGTNATTSSDYITTVTGEPVRLLGVVQVRWYCPQTNVPTEHRKRFPPKYTNAVFTIADTDAFDVILGRETINKLELCWPQRNIMAPWRSLPPQVNMSTVPMEQRDANERRRQEAEAMRQHQEQKNKQHAKSKAPSTP